MSDTTDIEPIEGPTPVDLARALGADVDSPPEYVPTSAGRVPIESWGSDHWSTLGYLECRIVDHRGKLHHDQMRCDPDRHPMMYTARSVRLSSSGRKYPTRLRGGVELADHDDYDCIDDMVAAGLVTVTMPDPPAGTLLTGLVERELMTRARYALTERGQAVAGALRAHKGAGGNWAAFQVPAELVSP